MDTNTSTQPVTLSTQTQYPIPNQKFMIPTSWRRYQLSQLINNVLELPKPVPFDFLVKGQLLGTTLAAWCAENEVGEEETLEIEYVESVMPPQKMSDIPHEDWVSSVLCQLKDFIFTASYDGNIRMFDYSKTLRSCTVAHSAPISSLCLISASDSTYTIASSSHDLTGQITQISLSEDGTLSSNVLATLHLHTAPLSSIHFYDKWLLTTSWDGLIGFWDTSIPPSDEISDPTRNDRSKKRRRVDEPKPKRKAPLSVLKSHTSRVSKAIFSPSRQQKAYSCGFDSTVRMWDTEYGTCEYTFSASEKPFLDLAVTQDGNTALATSTDRTLTMYDLRSPALTASSGSFFHPSTPSCIAVSEANSSHVVTGCYDGVVRVWDLRSTKDPISLFKVRDGGKVLCADWRRGLVGVGGECGLEIWKFSERELNQEA